MMKFQRKLIPVLLVFGVLIAAAATALPPVRERISWRLDNLRTRVIYTLFPPEKEVFVPQQDAYLLTVQAGFTATPPPALETAVPGGIAEASPTPTPIPTPLPASASLTGVVYTDQHGLWNYCAPANLAMALSFWGWEGTRLDVGKAVKPLEKDKNVMPYELENYVNEHTNLRVALRSGGTLEMVQRLVANGFPVLIEKGAYIRETATGKISWMGHYNLITGYEDAAQEFIVQDSYYTPDYRISYDLIQREWRGFNYVFMVVYPPELENALYQALAEYSDAETSYRIAAQVASDELYNLTGVDQFFAAYNRGTSLKDLRDYAGAAAAYDEAFRLYAALPEKDRPWRVMWYQTGPYFAYFYTGRYYDVINLATKTIDAASEPYLEENFYWRARASAALGDTPRAIRDLRTSLEYHPGFLPSVQLLQQLGEQP
ncbi:MAG: C39 family peptidase [Anaerolineaceae bacterium]|nr:C39 family peptidase [Anaerolineaceae bacterium]